MLLSGPVLSPPTASAACRRPAIRSTGRSPLDPALQRRRVVAAVAVARARVWRTPSMSRSTVCSPDATTSTASAPALRSRAQDARSHPRRRRSTPEVAHDGVRVVLSTSPPATSRRTAEWPRSDPDLILHLGDYQYEGLRRYRSSASASTSGPELRLSPTTASVTRSTRPTPTCRPPTRPLRGCWSGTTTRCQQLRRRDRRPAVRAARSSSTSRRGVPRLLREHAPAPYLSCPTAPDLQLLPASVTGQLASFHMLDTRQYRSDQACGDGYKDCPHAADPARSLPGMAQEEWLLDGFLRSRRRGGTSSASRSSSVVATTTPLLRRQSLHGCLGRLSRLAASRITQGWVDAGVLVTGGVISRAVDPPAHSREGGEGPRAPTRSAC